MTDNDYQVLFACSEFAPLVKTGGLADVCASLPKALRNTGTNVRVVLPGYKTVLEQLSDVALVGTIDVPLGPVAIGKTQHDGIELYLVCHPVFSNRAGNPYMSDDDRGWSDNPLRFALFSQAVIELATKRDHLGVAIDVVHCHDWQTGLVPALLALHNPRPATIFTIHNLAYQGNIMFNHYEELGLPGALFHANGIEFWGQASYIKGGIAYADRVNTVSPTYAREIQTELFGNGLDGLLRSRSSRVSGILNGIDEDAWNPATDPHLAGNFSSSDIQHKKPNKSALQKRMKLPENPDIPLFGVISRLAGQKGIDLLIDALDRETSMDYQLVVLGSGETELQNRLHRLQQQHPQSVAVSIGFDESLSRLIEAGSDVFVMPSRYEPCGLNQMYSLRYGTLPLVTPVGGLADTVISYTDNAQQANGFVIADATVVSLLHGIHKALQVYQDKKLWQQLQHNGMTTSFSWENSALLYQQLYKTAIGDAAIANEQIKSARLSAG
ncbi:MAG: glycogen synthase GlgA [Pseudomonadota bacterium]